MHILITGATGLIGSAIVQQLSEYRYTALIRSQSSSDQLPDYCQTITSLDQLDNLNSFDAVINLAGEPIADKRWSVKRKKVLIDSRCDLTDKLAQLFLVSDNPPKVWLSGSAIGIYGDGGQSELTEQSLFGKDFAADLCLQWEQLARQAHDVTRLVLLRTAVVLSPHGGALAKMLPPFKLGLGGPIGSGQQYMSWIHIDDYVSAIKFLLTTDIAGAVNMTSPNPLPNHRFTALLAKAVKRPAFFRVPQPILEALMGESSCLLLFSQQVKPCVLNNAGYNFQFSELEDAFADLI